MAAGKPDGVTDQEWTAIQRFRQDSASSRSITRRWTDPEDGAEYNITLSPEEAAGVLERMAKAVTGGGGDEGGSGRPARLQDYFPGKRKAAGGQQQ